MNRIRMKNCVEMVAFAICAMFICVFSFHVAKVDASGTNIIENGDFENALDKWTGQDNAVLSLAYYTKVSGNLGLKVSGRTKTYAGPYQNITGKV